MKRINASVMTVAVVLVLIAFVAPSSAYSIDNGDVVCNLDDTTTWRFTVTCGPKEVDLYDISHFTVAWCGGFDSVLGVKVGGDPLPESKWDYKTWYVGEVYEIRGIKIDSVVFKENAVGVEITLDGCYGRPERVEWVIKANGLYPTGDVDGPVACNPIPEFSTIAIPIASILGLLFFFNHRKRREE